LNGVTKKQAHERPLAGKFDNEFILEITNRMCSRCWLTKTCGPWHLITRLRQWLDSTRLKYFCVWIGLNHVSVV